MTYKELEEQNRQLKDQILILTQQLDWLKRQLFGRKGEQLDAKDADPNDSVIDWAPAAEASYAVIEMEQVNFAGYPFPDNLNPLSFYSQTRASIGKSGAVLWQYPVKSTNAAGQDEWNDRYRVWKKGAWSTDITKQSTTFTVIP